MLSCTHRGVLFLRSRLRYKLQKGRDVRAICILLNVPMRGAEKWHLILRLDNYFCNLVKMARMGEDSLA